MIRKKFVVGNWKLHSTVQQSSLLVARVQKHLIAHRGVEVIVAPGFLSLQPLSLEIDHRRLKLAAQNAYYKDEGAYTGEVSFAQLRGLVKYAIIGHSERRIYLDENLDIIRDKVAACVRSGIRPIICVGETSQERAAQETKQVLHDQITTALSNLTPEEVADVIIAYEPVWAISTFGGELANPSQIKPIIEYIRSQVTVLYDQQVSDSVAVLYGGSVDDQTAGGYMDILGCDGVLVGSASLNWHKFVKIIEAVNKRKSKH